MKNFKAPSFFIGLAIILSLLALTVWITQSRRIKDAAADGDLGVNVPIGPGGGIVDPANPLGPPIKPNTPLDDPGFGLESADPELLVKRIAQAFAEEGVEDFSRMLGGAAVDASTKAKLNLLAQKYPGLRKPVAIREVGDLEINKRTRWAIEYEGEEGKRDRIYLDLKSENGKWSVDKVSVPSDDPEELMGDDALTAAEAFLQAVLNLKFEEARKFVDASSVSDTRIAGLCILFEEGKYQMRKDKPLRAMFQRKGAVGYIANVVAADGEQAAQFGLIMLQKDGAEKWMVSEINLDRLLADYAQRVAGGDVYYSPLVKNPAGGDTLALYFDFDEDEVNPRTRRQLDIVAALLKTDTMKKLTLSGHTDAKGTKYYNSDLSERRADVVRDYLVASGVNAEQIVTIAKGSSQPRRPNVTEAGKDNPDGRRANRRTEIYLDF